MELTPGSAAPRRHRWHEEPGGWSCACGVICDHEAEPCGRHGACKIGQRRNPAFSTQEEREHVSGA